jgi:hypothetical protein
MNNGDFWQKIRFWPHVIDIPYKYGLFIDFMNWT